MPQLAPVPITDGLKYEDWVISSASPLLGYANGVYPVSYNNSITIGITSNAVAGNNPGGTITSGSGKGFDLFSFYFGCGLIQANAQLPGVAIDCTISLTATKINGTIIDGQSFTFTANPVPKPGMNHVSDVCRELGFGDFCKDFEGSNMIQATLPGTFRGLSSVQFTATTIGDIPTGAATLLDIDNLVACVRSS